MEDRNRTQGSQGEERDAALSRLNAEKATLESRVQELEDERSRAQKEVENKRLAVEQLDRDVQGKIQEIEQLYKEIEKVLFPLLLSLLGRYYYRCQVLNFGCVAIFRSHS